MADGTVYFLTKSPLTHFTTPYYVENGITRQLIPQKIHIFNPTLNYHSAIFLTLFSISMNFGYFDDAYSLITRNTRNIYMTGVSLYVSYPVNFGF